MAKRFFASRRTGLYLAVIREGGCRAEKIVMTYREPNTVPLPWIMWPYVTRNYSREDIPDVQRAWTARALPDSWKEYFRERAPGACGRWK